jgi:hypothetical protein
MAITRASLGRGPAIVTWNGATFYTRADFLPKHSPVWKPVGCSLHGQIDKYQEDFLIKIPLMIFGQWQNLSTLFPSSLLNPTVGTNIFGTTDLPLVILARNNDQITYANAQLTKLTDLYLGVNSELFAAAVEFTCLIANNTAPETAGAYFTRATGSYAETAFAKTNFLKSRWTGAWGSKTGFTAIVPHKGFNVAWTLDLKPDGADGYGTQLMYIGEGGLVAACKCIPIGPTSAQSDTAQAVHQAMGSLLSAGAADLTLTAASTSPTASVVLKNAGLVETTTAFGLDALRVNEHAWETTRGIAAGVAAAVATVA